MKSLIREKVLTKQEQIALNAKRLPNVSFTSIAYHMNLGWLYEAYRQTRKDGACGIDGVTAEEYEKNLKVNLENLLNMAKSGKYRAPAVRRTYIPKADGKELRPLGIPTFEDKILPRAVKMLIELIFEQDFYECSFGFRKNKSQHDALQYLWHEAMKTNGWIIDLDIRKYFDSIDHRKLQEVLKQRVKDGVIERLIGKWLNAGIMEDRNLYFTETGTPQGGVISPLLSNIYLHEVLDKWFVKEVKPRMNGNAYLVRFADDAIMGFEYELDAKRVMNVLSKRFGKYGLTIHPEKTKLIDFSRPYKNRKDHNSKSFGFLGFTHYWGITSTGKYAVKKKTAKERLKRGIMKIYKWCKENRHKPVKVQHEELKRKVLGHYAYYGITCNFKSINGFYRQVCDIWCKWLKRRTNKHYLNWDKFTSMLDRYPIPIPKIVHSVYSAKH